MITYRSNGFIFKAVVGAAAFAFATGEHFKSMPGPSPNLLLGAIATTSTSSTVSFVTYSPMTFAKVEPPPPIIPAGDRQEQG